MHLQVCQSVTTAAFLSRPLDVSSRKKDERLSVLPHVQLYPCPLYLLIYIQITASILSELPLDSSSSSDGFNPCQ